MSSSTTCDITSDQLFQWLRDCNYGKDFDTWAQHFRLGPSHREIWCKECSRIFIHHESDDSCPRDDAEVQFTTRTPISCSRAQCSMRKDPKGNFVRPPNSEEELCTTCRYPSEYHRNDPDVGDDAVIRALEGRIQTAAPAAKAILEKQLAERQAQPKPLPLSPEHEELLRHREEIVVELGKLVKTQCPFSTQHLKQFNIDSCYGRFPSPFLTTVGESFISPFTHKTEMRMFPACANCRVRVDRHPSDGTVDTTPAWEARSKMSCPRTTGTFAKNAKKGEKPFIHPDTGMELCQVCAHPVQSHLEGPDPGDAAIVGVLTSRLQTTAASDPARPILEKQFREAGGGTPPPGPVDLTKPQQQPTLPPKRTGAAELNAGQLGIIAALRPRLETMSKSDPARPILEQQYREAGGGTPPGSARSLAQASSSTGGGSLRMDVSDAHEYRAVDDPNTRKSSGCPCIVQ